MEDEEEAAARRRLLRVAPGLPDGDWSDATHLSSDSNDVWRLDDVVLRVCWRGDRTRLLTESLLGRAVPRSMRHPPVLGGGEFAGMTWQLLAYVPGATMADIWLDVPQARLRPIVADLAGMLHTLHQWTPTDEVGRALAGRERPHEDPIGVNILALPVHRALALIEPASHLDHVDPSLLHAVERRLEALADIDPFADDSDHVVVHGDAQLFNVLVDQDRIVALLDYEWCRRAPRDAELAIWLHALRVAKIRSPGRLIPPILGWMREDYPELFSSPDFEGRMWLYAIVFGLQSLLMWPPDKPEADLTALHNLHALRRLIEAPPEIDLGG